MHYHQVKLINVNLLLANKYYLLIKEEYKTKLNSIHSLSGKALEKQIKTIRDQRKNKLKL